jgi:hypothetical protein
MKVTKMNIEEVVIRITDAYLDNSIYEDRVAFILRDYFYDEDNEQLQERLDEIEKDIR